MKNRKPPSNTSSKCASMAKPDSSILPAEAEVPYAPHGPWEPKASLDSNETKISRLTPSDPFVGIAGNGQTITLTIRNRNFSVYAVKYLSPIEAIVLAKRLLNEAVVLL